MKRTFSLAVFLLTLTACSSATVGSSPVAVSPTAQQTITPSVTAAPTPRPTPDTSFARRIVGRLDELAILSAGGDGDATGAWANDEAEWVTPNMGRLMLGQFGLADYPTNIITLLTAVADGSDQTAAVSTLLAMRPALAASAGLPPPAPTPTPAPTPLAHKVGDRIVFTETDDDTNALWLTVVSVAPWKDKYMTPDAGNKFVTADVLFEGKSGEISARAGEFSITDASGYVYDISPMWKDPGLPYDNALEPGKKVRGWLTFEIPKGMKSGWVVFADTSIAFSVK